VPFKFKSVQATYGKKWLKGTRARDPHYDRHRNLWRKYRLRPETYAVMLSIQGGVCAICGCEPPADKNLVVDHEHKSGKVRGLLCNGCNIGLGGFKELPSNFYAALRYLELHGPKGPIGESPQT
jgi:hypothetical protein